MLKLSGVAKAGQHYLQHLTGNVQLATFIGLIKKLEKENLND